MEASLEYEDKVICDSPCQRCKHSREKSVDSHGQDIIWYCRTCQVKYLCNDVLGRDRSSSEYICTKCGNSVNEMTVERAHQLGLAFGIRITRTAQTQRPIEEIRRTWFYSPGRSIFSKDFVTDLINLETLDVPQIKDIMYHSDLSFKPEQMNLEKKRLLWDIFSKKPGIIKSLHNSLITRSEHRRVDLIIRALVNYEVFDCIYLSSIIPGQISGTIDLIGIDKTTGGIVWIIIQEEMIDEQLINTILNEIVSIPHLEFMGVERILLLTRKWIWMAAEIARKQGIIATRWKRLKLELWEEDSLFNYRKL
ncbi:MAG: hypothetical protein ACFFAJ_07990 [Candidatus Hodarchaeota archaeon]